MLKTFGGSKVLVYAQPITPDPRKRLLHQRRHNSAHHNHRAPASTTIRMEGRIGGKGAGSLASSPSAIARNIRAVHQVGMS